MKNLSRLLLLTALSTSGFTGAGYAATTVTVTAPAEATEGVSKELGGPGRMGRALGTVENNTGKIIGGGVLGGCALGGPLGCVLGITNTLSFVGSVAAAHAIYGAADYLYCEGSCTTEKGAAGGAAFSELITTWIKNGTANNKTHHEILVSLMQYIMSDHDQEAAIINTIFPVDAAKQANFHTQKALAHKALKCIKGCGTFATKNFMFQFLSTLTDDNHYGISIVASLLLDTTISWSVTIPNGDPKASKLAHFTKYDRSNCTNTTCGTNFDRLVAIATDAADPTKVAAAVEAAKVK